MRVLAGASTFGRDAGGSPPAYNGDEDRAGVSFRRNRGLGAD